jgi:hypothetical protein
LGKIQIPVPGFPIYKRIPGSERANAFALCFQVQGSAMWEGDWSNYTADFSIESNLSRIFNNELGTENPTDILGLG